GELEVALDAALRPRAGQHSVERTEILQFPVSHNRHDLSGGIFAFRFYLDGPDAGIVFGAGDDGDGLQREAVRARIDRSGYLFAIVMHLNQQALPFVLVRTPVPAPGTRQRMSKLRKRG